MKLSKISVLFAFAAAQKKSAKKPKLNKAPKLFNVPVDQGEMLQALKRFNTNITPQKISNHGCHCAKYSRKDNLGGTPVDALDEACFEWNKKMKCITLEGGACSNGIDINSYPIQLERKSMLSEDAEFACQYAGDECATAICKINYEVGLALWNSVSENGPGSANWDQYNFNPDCSPNPPSYSERVCKGDAPDVFIAQKEITTEPENSWPLIPDSEREHDGTVINMSSDLQAYYVAPKNLNSRKAVFVHFDIAGWTGGRIRSVTDHIAEANYHVFLVNFFDNDDGIMSYGGWPPTQEGYGFLFQQTPAKINSDIDTAMSFIDNQFPQIDSIGTIGFCFGGWIGLHHASHNYAKLKATASCHPSYQVEESYGGLLNLLNQINTPMLICPAGDDSDAFKQGGMIENNFIARGIPIEIQEFPEQRHGWVVRGDTSDPVVEQGVKDAVDLYMDFFERYL